VARNYADSVVTPITQDFDLQCRTCALDLQNALRALYAAVGADPARPQEVSRQFKLNKNLTWKVAKVIQSVDPIEAVPLIPGSEGMEILLSAMEAAGPHASPVSVVRSTLAAFESMVRTHVGDRPTLELLMDGMSRGGRTLEVSRKLAFRGNSGIWGVQARVRSMTQFLAPSAEHPELLDIALVGGLHDIRRLRPVQGWPLFRFTSYDTVGGELPGGRNLEAIEKPATPGEPHLVMRSFCSPAGAEVRSIKTDTGVSHELMDGPVGQRGSVTFMFGGLERAAVPRYSSPTQSASEHGEMGALVTMPTEFVHIDILIHRDLLNSFTPELLVYGRPFGGTALDPETRENYLLPIDEPIIRMDPARDSFTTDLLPDQQRVVDSVFARSGWDRRDFAGFRAVVSYPPMPSTVMIRYALSRAPGKSRGEVERE
jgi:hypothetical protein